MTKRLLITVGGTGGHIYPALSLAQQIRKKLPSTHLLFVGGMLAENRFFEKQPFDVRSVECGKLILNHPVSFASNLFKMTKGVVQSRQLIKQYVPDLVVGFGSYHTFPLLLASYFASIPFILHEANSIPGKVNRLLSRFSQATGVFFPESASALRGNILSVKMPLREEYHYNCCSKEAARLELGLESSLQTVLVFGGSQGAHTLNSKCCDVLSKYTPKDWQILHIAGHGEKRDSILSSYHQAGIKCLVKTFEDRMNLAWKAADFAIVRAGAGTIAEAIEFEVPTLLIPYPFATDQHQEKNADFLATIGGGVRLNENELIRLPNVLIELFFQHEKLNIMQKAIRDYFRQAKWKDLSELVIQELLSA